MIITPEYYQFFNCIADNCKHNCCIGWEIDIDKQTLDKYMSLKNDISKKILQNISFDTEHPHFILNKDERCPFLNEHGLCDIILSLGDDYICQICKDHPRFINEFSTFRESGLGLCCESAAQLILTYNKPFKLSSNPSATSIERDFLNQRQHIINLLQDTDIPLDDRINNVLQLYSINSNVIYNADFYAILHPLERLSDEWDNYLIQLKNSSTAKFLQNKFESAFTQLIIYFIFRHLSESIYDNRFKARLCFSIFSYISIKRMFDNSTIEKLIDICRMYSSEIEYSDENALSIIDYFDSIIT